MKRVSIALFVTIMAVSVFAQTAPQTVQDSMDGNWCVINGQKKFMTGMNIAWITSNTFGRDVGDSRLDINAFTTHIKKIRRAGGNCVRWWLHTDASNCPKIDETGAVTGIGSQTIANIAQALDTAYAYGVVVDLCLFSFDMLVPGDGAGKSDYSDYNLQSNHLFLTEPENIDTYLENGLGPILEAVGSHPAIMCWEVFNEPEGMLASANWEHVERKITQDDILRITNKIAGFVHRNSKKMVSTGIASTEYVAEYSDENLIAAGGDNDGYLDFYMVHYYPEWQGESMSPFHNPASHWNMDRPILIGEFPAKSWDSSIIGTGSDSPWRTEKDIVEAFEYAYQNEYAGAMSWSLTESNSDYLGNYETTKPALESLFDSHADDIMIKDVTIEEISGNYVMSLTLTDLPLPTAEGGAYNELGASFSGDWSGNTTLSWDMYVEESSGTNLQIVPVIKVGSEYEWSPAQDEAILLSSVDQGRWITFELPISSFGADDVSDVKEILFQYWATESAYTGNIYFDNVAVDGDTLFRFNSEGSTWTSVANESNVGLVSREDIATDIIAQPDQMAKAIRKPTITAKGKTVFLRLNKGTNTHLSIIDLSGKSIRKVNCGALQAGVHTFSFKDLSAGQYIARVRKGKQTVSSRIVLQ